MNWNVVFESWLTQLPLLIMLVLITTVMLLLLVYRSRDRKKDK